MSQTQLQGLSSSQVSGIVNSPNYSSFSSSIKTYAASASNPTQAAVINNDTGNTGAILKYKTLHMVVMIIICFLI